jgi:hypothetical protein
LHLENLVRKLRKEGEALQRVEESIAKAYGSSDDNNTAIDAFPDNENNTG